MKISLQKTCINSEKHIYQHKLFRYSLLQCSKALEKLDDMNDFGSIRVQEYEICETDTTVWIGNHVQFF